LEELEVVEVPQQEAGASVVEVAQLEEQLVEGLVVVAEPFVELQHHPYQPIHH
jgi:hypothetical protein